MDSENGGTGTNVPSSSLFGAPLFNPLSHGIKGQPLMVSAEDYNRIAFALQKLMTALDDFKGHGMPGFRDRAEGMIAMHTAEKAMKHYAPNTVLDGR